MTVRIGDSVLSVMRPLVGSQPTRVRRVACHSSGRVCAREQVAGGVVGVHHRGPRRRAIRPGDGTVVTGSISKSATILR